MKLIVYELDKKFSAFDETQRFITMIKSICHLSITHERWIPATLFHHVSFLSSVLILPSFMLRFSYMTFFQVFEPKKYMYFFLASTCHKSCHLFLFHFIISKYLVRISDLHYSVFVQPPVTSSLRSQYLQHPCLEFPQPVFFL